MEIVREFHFLNGNKFDPGKFSCALDCFLELWLEKIDRFMGKRTESYIIRLLSVLSDQYRSFRSEFQSLVSRAVSGQMKFFYTLHVLRGGIWTYNYK